MQHASPSSSATTPSPPLPFLQPHPTAGPPALSDLDPHEREERQRAVKKFLARAECAKLTRSLRARLAYASYKATHNVAHVPLPVLEHQLAPAPAPPPAPPSPYPKRRAPDMPPPSTTRSLYASLLGGPPPKRPRHVYGPAPTPADLLPSYSPAPQSPATPSRRKQAPPPRSPFVNGGQGRTVRTVLQGRARSNVTEKEDMNAAATLTALMFNRASPRQGPARARTPDADAAELMLYLATSPSPVRPPAPKRTPGAAGMGRVLFASAGAGAERDATPGLTASQGSLPSSQETQLLPPPLSPSPPHAPPKNYDVSRRLFVEGADDARRGFGLGKGIDLVEAK